ncbi:MAG: DUF3347 domain-containing protein [Phycisphaerae bacterium]|nr:DUF3347 domain-containing protein [Phycisphaerae bacterium]
MRFVQWTAIAALLLISVSTWAEDPAGDGGGSPVGAKFACPMETHPDQGDPREQGAYFAENRGDCPWCGMKLEPLDELDWARARRAAEGAEVAYTCPYHQQVFSRIEGECPRCERPLEPFRAMYTCPNPVHASVIHLHAGTCPKDGRKLVPFRGVWLSEEMGARNAPPKPELADLAAFRCPLHPLVHSDQPGHCMICARELESIGGATKQPAPGIPADAQYVCPMEECHYFAAEPGECPTCGMRIKPIADVEWARKMKHAPTAQPAGDYVCPMHPRETAGKPGRCGICGMQLVAAKDLPQPKTAPEAVQVQMNHLMEHYLELQQRFAADRTTEAAQQAQGLIAAADGLERLLDESTVKLSSEFRAALKRLREATVRIHAEDLAASRVAFVDLSAALREMVAEARPSRDKYGKIYIFHCPMSKGDWLQASADMKNPYYGFEMLKCGELVSTE